MFRWGASLIHLGNGFVRSIAQAYGYCFFFCAATAIYLLLRQDIDEAPLDQVFDDVADEEPMQLPPLPPDLLTPSADAIDSPGSRDSNDSLDPQLRKDPEERGDPGDPGDPEAESESEGRSS